VVGSYFCGELLFSYKLRATVDCIIEVREGKNQNCMRGRNLFTDFFLLHLFANMALKYKKLILHAQE